MVAFDEGDGEHGEEDARNDNAEDVHYLDGRNQGENFKYSDEDDATDQREATAALVVVIVMGDAHFIILIIII